MTEAPNLVPKTPDLAAGATGRARVLAEVLETVHLSGAVFLQGEFAEPWGFDSPSAPDLTASLAPGAKQLVLFHAVLEGECQVQVDTGESARLGPGELVVLPYGNQHRMFNPDGSTVVPIADLLPPPPWENMQVCRFGDPSTGRQTRILCSYLECQDILFSPLLGVLPPLIKVTPSPGAQSEWLRASLLYTRSLGPVPTSGPLAARLPEMLLLEALRQYLESLPPERSGWLAALADPVVGPALVEMHGDPARPWTVNALADRLAVSRSVLAARFVEKLGQSPMRYLALWRLHLACHLLRIGSFSVAEVAIRVGYESEAAFSRAFKRHLGIAPGSFRQVRASA